VLFPANLKVFIVRAVSSNQCTTLNLEVDSTKLVANPFGAFNRMTKKMNKSTKMPKAIKNG
jgi:hypothetical protein